MRTGWWTGIALAAAIGGAGIWFARAEVPPTRTMDSVAAVVERAAGAWIPGAAEFSPPANFSEGLPSAGWRGRGGDLFAAHTMIGRFDWTGPSTGAPEGIPGLILAQADLHARILAEAGFIPLDSGVTVSRPPGTKDVLRVSTKQSSNGGSRAHGWRSPPDPDRLVHRRLYYAPGTGGFVAIRIEYEKAWKAATVETTWLEATGSFGDPRPFPNSFRETLTGSL